MSTQQPVTTPSDIVTAHQLAHILLDMPADAVVLIPALESGYNGVTTANIKPATVTATPHEPYWHGEYRTHKAGNTPAVIIDTSQE